MAAERVLYVEAKLKSFRLKVKFQFAELSVIVVRAPFVSKAIPDEFPTVRPPPVMLRPPAKVEVAVEVEVIDPVVRSPVVMFEKVAAIERKMFAKSIVEVALTATSEDELKFVEVELVKFAFVPETIVEKKLVVVADVPVAFWKVKFWRVVEPESARLEAEIVPVAKRLARKRLPENNTLP